MAFLVLLLIAGVFYAGWRTRELFCLSVRDGRTLLVRGRIPPGLLGDIEDVVRASGARRASIRAVPDESWCRIVVGGDLGEDDAQRLQNLFVNHPVASLRRAPAPARPTLGQVLGIAWLAWFLGGRDR